MTLSFNVHVKKESFLLPHFVFVGRPSILLGEWQLAFLGLWSRSRVSNLARNGGGCVGRGGRWRRRWSCASAGRCCPCRPGRSVSRPRASPEMSRQTLLWTNASNPRVFKPHERHSSAIRRPVVNHTSHVSAPKATLCSRHNGTNIRSLCKQPPETVAWTRMRRDRVGGK